MDVVDRLDLRIALDRDRIKARHFAHLHERGIELRQGLHGRGRPHVLVLVEQRQPVDVLYRDHRVLETAVLPGFRRTLLTLDRIGVDVGAREAVLGRDQIG